MQPTSSQHVPTLLGEDFLSKDNIMDIYDEDTAPFDEFGPPHYEVAPDMGKVAWEHNPEHTPRSGPALRVTRESLGLSAADLARALGVGLTTVQFWEAKVRVPGYTESALRSLIDHTNLWLLSAKEAGQVGIHRKGYRVVDRFLLPESWWHVVVGRALSERPVIPVELQ